MEFNGVKTDVEKITNIYTLLRTFFANFLISALHAFDTLFYVSCVVYNYAQN